MLEVKRLNAGYGRAQVLFDLDLELQAGEVAVLLGRNGAGKSTALKTIMGLLRPVSGQVWFEGLRVDGLEPFEIARRGLGYVPEERRIFTDLTVAENLAVGHRHRQDGAQGWNEARVFALFPALQAMRDRLGARMSGGEQQMLSMARTLAGNPRGLLLDEPSEGLAPRIVDQIAGAILELKAAGIAVLLCEQNAAFAARVADHAYLIDQGRVQRRGSVREMRENLLL